jgi:hypothetical protein
MRADSSLPAWRYQSRETRARANSQLMNTDIGESVQGDIFCQRAAVVNLGLKRMDYGMILCLDGGENRENAYVRPDVVDHVGLRNVLKILEQEIGFSVSRFVAFLQALQFDGRAE